MQAYKPSSWHALEEVPEGQFAEIVNGQLVVLPRPGGPHTETSSRMTAVLLNPLQFGQGDGPGGWVILHEPGVALVEDIRIPDLAGWRAHRYERPKSGPYTVVPDWVCEVLSPGAGARRDRTEKLPLYALAGVPYVWLVDPVVRSLEIYMLTPDPHGALHSAPHGALHSAPHGALHYTLIATAVDAARLTAPRPFDGVVLELGQFWGAPVE